MLPKYMRHVESNPETLLTRFYGVHRVKPSHGRKVRTWQCLYLAGFVACSRVCPPADMCTNTGQCGGFYTLNCPGLPRPALPPGLRPPHTCRFGLWGRTVCLLYALNCPALPCPLNCPSPQVRFVVMNNVFRTDLELHRKYDLKGSTYGRTAGPRLSASGALRGGGNGRSRGAAGAGAAVALVHLH